MKVNLTHTDTFAIYSLPNEEHHFLVRSSKKQVIPFESLSPDESAFVFHPFTETDHSPALAILPEQILMNPVFTFCSEHTGNPVSLSESSYVPLVEQFVDEIQQGGFHKIISSRIIEKFAQPDNLYPLFMKLKEQYPLAFVYLVNIPDVGCWMGATPEILLTIDENDIGETVALAGTQPLLDLSDWGKKEITEQAMVEQYMANILIKRKKNFRKYGPYNARAGQVVHLKTRFTFPVNSGWKEVAMDIHPSPAVCGLPKESAREFIIRTEPHDREYYCGFLGPVNWNGRTDLFVNLRCMQVFSDKFALYVGGGITFDSIPEKELDETRWKSRTLSDIIETVCQPTQHVIG